MLGPYLAASGFSFVGTDEFFLSMDPKFIIISQPRTGSNNVSYGLNAHPALTVGNELLHPVNGVPKHECLINRAGSSDRADSGQVTRHWSCSYTDEVFDRVVDGIFSQHNGFKIHTQHITRDLFERLLWRSDLNVVITVRASKFWQAMSNFLAERRNVWQAGDVAAGKEKSVEPFEINPGEFIAWINYMYEDLVWLNNAVTRARCKFTVVEYELFYSGDRAQKIERVNRLFDFLGVSRIGRLDLPDREETYSRLMPFLDSDKQKVTSEVSVRSVVMNFTALQAEYERWRGGVVL